MKISHHIDDATLMSYAAGSLPEALAAVVSTHLAMCPHCRREFATMQRIGVSMFNSLAPAPVDRTAPVLQLRAMEADVAPAAKREAVADEQGDVPAPLRHLVGTRLSDIAWKRLGPGVWHFPLPVSSAASGDLRLLKVAPGRAVPEHGHGGAELTLLLQGAYEDELGRFSTGDIADLDETVEHQPVADKDTGCICLVASEHKARFKGLLPRLVQPLTGM